MRVYFGGTTEIRRSSSRLMRIIGVIQSDFVPGPIRPDLTDNGDT